MDAATRFIEGQKMPRPWFRANPINSTMGFVTGGAHNSRVAPLTEGERALGWFVLPPFQRPPVWSQEQQIRFIESAWSGLPIGVFVVNRPSRDGSPYDNWLLDGQQRIGAVLAYVADEFPVFGHRFSELERPDLARWSMGVSFSCLETNLENEADLLEVYDRLAYGGVPHEPKLPSPPDA
jgi:hypothetical protein